MAKFDAVDRLLRQATERPIPSGDDAARKGKTATSGSETGPTPVALAPDEAAQVVALETGPAPHAPGERGRQLLNALRPLLPAMGGALRMVDHGGVQAVARLLPLLGSLATGSAKPPLVAAQFPAEQGGNPEKQNALEGEVRLLRQRVEAQDEQLRRVREGLERTVAEQGSLAHLAHRLQDRSRLLTAGLLILLLLVIAQAVLLAIVLRH